MILIVSLIFMTLTGAIGALLLKYVSLQKTWYRRLVVLGGGGIFYLMSSVANIVTLKYYDYSLVYPATAIAFIWTMLLGRLFLKESITKYKVIGCVMIIVGTYLLTK